MAKISIEGLFPGNKAKWLPLYRRLAARLSSLPGIEIEVRAKCFILKIAREPKVPLGAIRIMVRGLEVGLALPRGLARSTRLKPVARSRSVTHRILVREAGEIDDELLNWIKGAAHLARTAKDRSA